MPKEGRVADTIAFLRTAALTPKNAEDLRQPVTEWLEESTISPAIDQGMSQGSGGTELTRKYRRAMILILCALNNTPVAQAQRAVAAYPDASLQSALGTMILEVQKVAAPKRLNPIVQQLLMTPANFLAANRIKIGSGGLKASSPIQFEFSWSPRDKLYLMEPPVAWHHYLHANLPGYNIAVTNFADIVNLGQITGAVVQGNIALTTQLSGCTIFYSVHGNQLVVAHVWPKDVGPVKANLPPALAGQAGLPAGVVQALRLAYQGDLANAIAGGTLGLFGMVANAADTGLRAVGPRNIRMHGYVDTAGNAYFVAVLLAGTWHLFGQQNNPGRPADGVASFVQIYP